MSGESQEGLEMRKSINDTTLACSSLIKVKHMVGTANWKPNDYNSWKDFWENKSSLTFPTVSEECPCCHEGRNPDDFVGSHIYEVADKNKMYIYPICNDCNLRYSKRKKESDESHESDEFEVKKVRCVTFQKSDYYVDNS